MNAQRITTSLIAGLLVAGAGGRATAQVTTEVSISSSGAQGDAGSTTAATSGDGRYVVFESPADNLVAGDTNVAWDIFVRDRATGTTVRVSVDSSGVQGDFGSYDPAISADGRFVAFRSFADNLVPNDLNGFHDIFVHDLQTGTTEIVSVDSSGAQANNNSWSPTISADGRYVVFYSDATNLVANDVNGFRDIFVHDRVTGITELVSVDSTGVQGNGDSIDPTISADGSIVAFSSTANNLVVGDTNLYSDVFARDRTLGTTELVSQSTTGKLGNSNSDEPSISADGKCVAFRSSATNLAPGDINLAADIFVRDRIAATTELVSVDSSGILANDNSFRPSISGDGGNVAFASFATNLVANDTNGVVDVFQRNRSKGKTTRVSVDSTGAEANGVNHPPSISADARFVAFYSDATNLVPNDLNAATDCFMHGPDLTLEVIPASPTSGQLMTFLAWTGKPGGLNMLVLDNLNGTPLFKPILTAIFNAAGSWSISAPTPPGLAGLSLSFEELGIVPTGKVGVSNTFTVTFQ
jgi:Tol biopolymer transport system component